MHKLLITLKSVQNMIIIVNTTILSSNHLFHNNNKYTQALWQLNMFRNQQNNTNKDILLLGKIHKLWGIQILKWQLYQIINNNPNHHLNKMLECSLLGKMEDLLRKDSLTRLINRILSCHLFINLLLTNLTFNLKLSKETSNSNLIINKDLPSDKETHQLCTLLILLRIHRIKLQLPSVIEIKYLSLLLLKEWWDNPKIFPNKKHSDFYDSSSFFTIKVF